MICLDTNIAIAAMGKYAPPVRRNISDALMNATPVGISSVVLHELWYGIRKSLRPKVNTEALENFLALGIAILPFETADAEAAGQVRAQLERVGRPIGPYDILIAAHAIRCNAVLVTANTLEFSRVPGLRIEDWTRP